MNHLDIFRNFEWTDDGCMEWTGGTHNKGYGRVCVVDPDRGVTGISRPTHRVAYELAKGPIPEGLVIDHLCRNPRCINPAHLEAVTNAENLRRGAAARALQGRAA